MLHQSVLAHPLSLFLPIPTHERDYGRGLSQPHTAVTNTPGMVNLAVRASTGKIPTSSTPASCTIAYA